MSGIETMSGIEIIIIFLAAMFFLALSLGWFIFYLITKAESREEKYRHDKIMVEPEQMKKDELNKT